jgi:Type II secretory pathway, component PulF
MNEFIVKLADERGRVQEQTHAAASAEELRARFTQAGYLVYSVKARSTLGRSSKKKIKLDAFLIFNQQFLTLIKAGLPILSSLDLLAKRQKDVSFRAQLEDVSSRVKTGESISAAFEAQGTMPLVYTTTLLAGVALGQSRRGAAALPGVPARVADISQEAAGVADLSGVSGGDGDWAVHVPDHVCGAAVCFAL